MCTLTNCGPRQVRLGDSLRRARLLSAALLVERHVLCLSLPVVAPSRRLPIHLPLPSTLVLRLFQPVLICFWVNIVFLTIRILELVNKDVVWLEVPLSSSRTDRFVGLLEDVVGSEMVVSGLRRDVLIHVHLRSLTEVDYLETGNTKKLNKLHRDTIRNEFKKWQQQYKFSFIRICEDKLRLLVIIIIRNEWFHLLPDIICYFCLY